MRTAAGLLRVAALLFLVAPRIEAQRSTHVRVFHPAGSYAATVSISGNGTVVCRGGDSSTITRFDGYSRRELQLPEESTYRPYQSRSGQVWILSPSGVWLYHAGQWTHHPIAEIAAEFRNYPSTQLHQIGLLPAEVNHLLILLHDRLLDYEASERKIGLIREAKSTHLGEFTEIHEGMDEAIWISGTFGIAHLQGPARRITPQTLWGEYLLPQTNQLNNLQRPFEYPGGTVTTCVIPPEQTRAVAQWRDDRWSIYPMPAGEKIRQAWGGVDEGIWGYSANSLFRMSTQPTFTLHKEPVVGSQYDVAVETNGVFWIASSEGLIRHAPNLWRSRPDLQELQSAVHSIVFNGTNAWLATPEGLLFAPGASPHRLYPWPEEIENLLPPRESMFRLNDGRLLIAAQARPFVFDPEKGSFKRLATPRAAQVHLLGQMLDGSICAWFEHSGKAGAPDLRFYDGTKFTPLELSATNWNHGEFTFAKEIARGDLWLGGASNLFHLRMNTGTLEVHGLDQGLNGDRVLALGAIGEGRIWCGTASRIYELRGRRWETVFNTSERVTAIHTAAGSVWVATSGGVYRYVQDSWIPHGANEGLPAGAVYTLRTGPNDLIWAGTSRGAAIFHPEADLDPPHTLPPVIQDADKLSTVVPTMVSFRGVDKWDYTTASDLLYSYKMDEGGWTPFSNVTSRTFHNLSAGKHTLEILAMDRNGNKAPRPGRTEFAIIVPWFMDPRLLGVSIFALALVFVFAGLAVNKHLELKRSYAEVEQIVDQRTSQLEKANRELLHSQKMRAIGTMAAGIAHDFNNILSIIRGSAQVIESHVDDKEKIRTRVNRIQTVVEQGSSIVQALLGLGTMNERELAACDLAALLHQTRKLLSDQFPPAVQIHIETAPDLPPVICSEEVIQQMLLNFILNAAEAMSNEGLVRLSAEAVAQPPSGAILEPTRAGQYVLISVTDQGTGISPENLSRIFEPFFTTKAFSSRRGTGLGLSMVYELAKGLGYGLAVRTAVGEGSTFTLIIPCLPAELPNGGKREKTAGELQAGQS